jgi:ribosome-associated heat shock protein Hsp15
VRIDKWLWAARFYKTRSLASVALGLDRVRVNGAPVKASREVRLGEQIDVRQVGARPEQRPGLGHRGRHLV